MQKKTAGIGRKTLTDQVYEYLKQGIIEYEFPPGTRLCETELASLLNVSPTPIREALNKLRSEGLVVGNSWQGSFVIELSWDDVQSLFDLREILEVSAVRQACFRVTEEDLLNLDKLLKDYAEAYEAKDIKRISELNTSLHGYWIEKSGNKWLRQVLDELRVFIMLARTPLLQRSTRNDRYEAVVEHRAIVSALKKKDVEAAELAVKNHINRMKAEMREFMESRSDISQDPKILNHLKS